MSAEFESLRQRFYTNPAINPRTGARIQIGKKTYNDLVKEFGVPPGQQVGAVSAPTVGAPSFMPGVGFFTAGAAPAPIATIPGSTSPKPPPFFVPGALTATIPGIVASRPPPTFVATPTLPTTSAAPLPSGFPQSFAPAPLPSGFPQSFAPAPLPSGFPGTFAAALPGTISSKPAGISASFTPMVLPGTKPAPAPFPQGSVATIGGLVNPQVPLPSVLVVLRGVDDNEFYVIPHDPENNDLIEDMLSIDGTSQDTPELTEAQKDVYELLDTNLSAFYYDGPLRGVNIDTVVRISEGTSEIVGEGGYASSGEEEEGELSTED